MDTRKYLIIYWKESTCFHSRVSLYADPVDTKNMSIRHGSGILTLNTISGTQIIPLTSIDCFEIRKLGAKEYDDFLQNHSAKADILKEVTDGTKA